MNNVPQQQKALFLESQFGDLIVQTTSIPKPGSGQVLVKVKATSLNPHDWKIRKYGGYPDIVLSDIAGEVAALGEGVTKFQVGDRVLVRAKMTKEYSPFQQYALADDYQLAKIPSNLTFDQAASIPNSLTTAYLAMYNAMPHGIALTNPVDPAGQGHYKGEPFVVIGASPIGQFAIQLAKLSGFSPIITTASVKHTDYLKSLGAAHVLDRNLSPSALKAEVEKITDKPIKYVYDAISYEENQKQGDAVLASGGYIILMLSPSIAFSDKHIVSPITVRWLDRNSKLLIALYEKLPEWFESGAIRPNEVEVVTGGLDGIAGGLKRIQNNQASEDILLVARPEETN